MPTTRTLSRWTRRLIGVAAVAALPVTLIAAPAQAASNSGAYSTYYLDGGGSLGDDFGDNDNELGNSLCYGCSDSQGTDLVITWQAILYAEGFLSKSGIDGYFGPGTKAATQAWQRRFALDDDGMVGPASWSSADARLKWNYSNGKYYVLYDAMGTGGYVKFSRGSTLTPYDGGAYMLLGADNGPSWTGFYPTSAGKVYFFKKTTYAL